MLTLASPQDRVYLRESNNCLEIATNSSKRELFNKWIRKRYNVIQPQGNESPSPSNCRLQIEKVMSENSNESEFSLGQRTAIKETDTLGKGKSTSSLLLGEGTQGFIKVNDQRVALTCSKVFGGNYRIRIALESDSLGIATEVVIAAGIKTNLGSIVEDLNKKAISRGIPHGVSQNIRKGKVTYNYFLSAKP